MENTRNKAIVKSGYLFILINFLLAVFNFVVGLISNSLAIVSDALHSLIDSVSGFLIVISEKIAHHHRFTQYRETIERFTTIIIALIIIATGIHITIESIEKIIAPEDIDYSIATITVLVASIVIKYTFAVYLKRTGKKLKSSVLNASGAETMNDTWISIAVLVSAIIYLIFHIDIEAYISIVISIVIVKVGLEFIFPHISKHHHHHFETNPDHDHCGHTTRRE